MAREESELASHLGRARSDAALLAGPARPLRYKVQFTANQEFVDLLREASDLLGHEKPRPTLPDVQVRALRLLVKALRKQKRATLDETPVPGPPGSALDAPARVKSKRDTVDAPARVESPIDPGHAPARLSQGADTAFDAPARVESPIDASDATPRVSLVADDAGDATPRVSHGADDAFDTPARVESPIDADPATPRASPLTPGASPREHWTRHIPAPDRRAVWDRDDARCAYRDDRGERCEETSGLELHHVRAHALGGPPTAPNLELRCRAHNTLAAELDFGRAHMDHERGVCEGPEPAPPLSLP